PRGARGRAEDRRVALRRLPRALRRGAAAPRPVRRAVRRRPDARARARLLHAHDVRVHRPRRERQLDDLRRRALRRAHRADRRAADAGHRLRSRARAPAARARERGDRGRAAGARRLLRRRPRRGPGARARAPRGAAPPRRLGRRRLRGPLLQGADDSGRPERGARDRDRACRRCVDPPGREWRRTGRARRGRRYAHDVSWRDLHCGELSRDRIGGRVTVAGWADTRRDHGGLVFVDLRDHTGKVQLVVNPERAADAAETAKEIRNEFVLQAEGEVVARAPEAVNPNLATGEVEIQVDRLAILSRSTPLPFQLDEENVDETTRLRYRWLDMRGARMQRNLRMAHTAIAGMRRTMDDLGFVDVWTPSMTRGTPEGARDFLVPVRLQPGKFFALAQSPQLFKQLCMVGGIDRYYQIATCWRDEDLRADRQFEFRQLDLEMAFVEQQEVLDVMEAAVVGAFEAVGRTPPARPFPHIGYDEAMARFGMEIQDATEITRDSGFGVFKNAPCVRFIVAPRSFSRSEHQRLEQMAKEWGAKGLAMLSQVAKFLSERELASFGVEEGHTAFFVADHEPVVAKVLGLLRLHLANELDLIPEED